MAYIDREKVMTEINRIGGHNLCEWDTIGVKALIDRQPTADVVPRSEVEEANLIIKQLTDQIKMLNDQIEQAKQEVAREIFEEIEEDLNNLIKYYKEKRKYVTEVDYNELEQLCCDIKIRTFEERLLKIAELKKKYIGE